RDYLYIPLGGNRHGTWQTYRNLMLTMLLGGLWHGAAWTFVVWGGYHGLLLGMQRAISWPTWMRGGVLRPARWTLTFRLVCVGWVFFRAGSLAVAGTVLERMVTPVSGIELSPDVAALVGALLGAVLVAHLVGTFANVPRLVRALPAPVLGTVLAGGFLL